MTISRNAIWLRRRNRGISVVLAVCYGLAVTAAGLFHEHGDSDDEASCVAASVTPGCLSDDQESPLQQPSPRQCPPDGSQCSVYKFLAQRTLPVCAVEEVTSTALVQAVIIAAPPQSAAPVTLSWHSRAPPDLA